MGPEGESHISTTSFGGSAYCTVLWHQGIQQGPSARCDISSFYGGLCVANISMFMGMFLYSEWYKAEVAW